MAKASIPMKILVAFLTLVVVMYWAEAPVGGAGVVVCFAVYRVLGARPAKRWVSWCFLVLITLIAIMNWSLLTRNLIFMPFQLAWVAAMTLVFFQGKWSLRTGFNSLSAANAARQAKQKQVADARVAEQRHAAKIHREQRWREVAVGPGQQTGLEPDALADQPIATDPNVWGAPGLSLGNAQDQAAKRVREGQQHFARALSARGIHAKHAVFWNVQLPQEGAVGASLNAVGGVDCVVLTGRSLWLIDVKNFAQGGVRWLTDGDQLVAVDLTDGGQVGEARLMGKSLSVARDRWVAKLDGMGIRAKVHAEVTMLPRHNGLGDIPQLSWTGNVPISGVGSLLDRLARESAFDPDARHMDLIVQMLAALVMTSAGHAPRPGERRRAGPPCSNCKRELSRDSITAGFCVECTSPIAPAGGPALGGGGSGAGGLSGVVPPTPASPAPAPAAKPCANPDCRHTPSDEEISQGYCFECATPLAGA